MRVGVILGSVRQHRKGAAVADWVVRSGQGRAASYELIDLAEHELPYLSEPVPPKAGHYTQESTKSWSAFINGFDGFVIITPEYNGGIPGVLKNALDHLYAEWNGKPVGLVGYGIYSGARALAQLTVLVHELRMADAGPPVKLSVPRDFDEATGAPLAQFDGQLTELLDAVEGWRGHHLRETEVASSMSAR